MQQADRMANEAVYTLQMNSRDAVRYIQRNAKVDEKSAVDALKATVDWARKQK
jgi:hypothetical protein